MNSLKYDRACRCHGRSGAHACRKHCLLLRTRGEDKIDSNVAYRGRDKETAEERRRIHRNVSGCEIKKKGKKRGVERRNEDPRLNRVLKQAYTVLNNGETNEGCVPLSDEVSGLIDDHCVLLKSPTTAVLVCRVIAAFRIVADAALGEMVHVFGCRIGEACSRLTNQLLFVFSTNKRMQESLTSKVYLTSVFCEGQAVEWIF